MSAVQTTYLTELAQAFVGMIVNTEPNNLISREAEGAIDFGKVVKQGTLDNQVVEADNASDVVRGISVRDYSAVNSAFADKDSALIMDRGVIWGEAGGTCTVGTDVYAIPASGKFTSTSTSNLSVPNAVFDSTAADGDLVKVRIK